MRILAWGLCAMVLSGVLGWADAPGVPEVEIEVGRAAAKDMEQRYGVVTDAALNGRLNRLGTQVARTAAPRIAFHFAILDYDEPNAVTLPGGFVFVTRGLLKLLPEDSLLTAALGHEVAHVALGHMSEMLREQAEGDRRMAAAGQAAQSDDAPQSTVGANMHAREKAADLASVRYLVALHIDPRVMVTLLRRLSEQPELNAEGSVTHPTWPDRIRNVQRAIQVQTADAVPSQPAAAP